MGKEADPAEAVVQGYNYDSFLRERIAGVDGSAAVDRPPPWIQTITGRGCDAVAGRDMLRKRQSSDLGTSSACMHAGPNLLASRTPDQAATGCGTRQRSLPTGGSGIGNAFQLMTPSLATPRTSRSGV